MHGYTSGTVMKKTTVINGEHPFHWSVICPSSAQNNVRNRAIRVKWVPVTTAWRALRLRMEERPPICRVAANKLNKQTRTADEGWSYSLGLGEVLTTLPMKTHVK
jgi:hypothetical protein